MTYFTHTERDMEDAHDAGFEAGYAKAVEDYESGEFFGASWHLRNPSMGDCS
jgi:hypothetical protein